ncbi:hypothetical protein C6A86_014025 [Mycobacterium sp. ITM-2016-00316]|uniref:hypothetical protein n=1 Tax=Mycobacterium sp. ITM-2016-00316 TaxID=2099695 RepID=UPI000CF927DE|nr:hypothetical protein [Mycobacterium sp. ITM-2016-00316]WNG84672.1 hypothetical protein C6A86_014025 [Mycobacterium sp. ITM-2016-00316]
MRKLTRTLLVGATATLALTACSGGTETATTPSPSATETSFPPSAKYIADMPAADGRTMTIGIAVDGDQVAAYACNGVDDEAWFFGDQSDGRIDITGKFRDTLRASVDGADVVGDLTMDGVAYRFTAASVPAPAGMYTGEAGGVRATWVVRPGDSATGVQHEPGAKSAMDSDLLSDEDFRDQVRNARTLTPASPILSLQEGTGTADIDGQVVTLQVVDGDFRL